jgi:hypothetical protein
VPKAAEGSLQDKSEGALGVGVLGEADGHRSRCRP